MRYVVESSFIHFDAWAGGKEAFDKIVELGFVDEVEQYFEEISAGMERDLTDTEINDILWFESDQIAEYLGLDVGFWGDPIRKEEEQ